MTDDERLEALASQELPRIEAFCASIVVKVSGVAQKMGLPPVALLYAACDLLATYLLVSGASAEERASILQAMCRADQRSMYPGTINRKGVE